MNNVKSEIENPTPNKENKIEGEISLNGLCELQRPPVHFECPPPEPTPVSKRVGCVQFHLSKLKKRSTSTLSEGSSCRSIRAALLTTRSTNPWATAVAKAGPAMLVAAERCVQATYRPCIAGRQQNRLRYIACSTMPAQRATLWLLDRRRYHHRAAKLRWICDGLLPMRTQPGPVTGTKQDQHACAGRIIGRIGPWRWLADMLPSVFRFLDARAAPMRQPAAFCGVVGFGSQPTCSISRASGW